MDHKQVSGMSDVSMFLSSTAQAAAQGGLLPGLPIFIR